MQAQDKDRGAALMMAAQYNYTDCLRVLLDNGVPVNSADNTGSTALIMAAQSGKGVGSGKWPGSSRTQRLGTSVDLRPCSHRTQSTSQHAHANYGTHCSKLECSHMLQATSKGLHANLCANLLTCPV